MIVIMSCVYCLWSAGHCCPLWGDSPRNDGPAQVGHWGSAKQSCLLQPAIILFSIPFQTAEYWSFPSYTPVLLLFETTAPHLLPICPVCFLYFFFFFLSTCSIPLITSWLHIRGSMIDEVWDMLAAECVWSPVVPSHGGHLISSNTPPR